MRTFKGQRGLSLIEVTIMLLVLMLLTGVLAPSIFDFVNDAKWVKVKEDCEAIAVSVARLHRDVGCIRLDGTLPCTKVNRVDLLYSDGPQNRARTNAGDIAVAGDGATNFFSPNMKTAGYRWDDDLGTYADSLENQMVVNSPAYPLVGPASPIGPNFNTGWRGAYLSPPIGPDPWGHKYEVNSVFLTIATNATAVGSGHRNTGWTQDAFCISAGPNGIYQTAFGGNSTGGVVRQADDFITIISGGTR